MKWIFAILVALNLIVFSINIIDKLVLQKVNNLSAQQQQQQDNPRTIVIQTPPAQAQINPASISTAPPTNNPAAQPANVAKKPAAPNANANKDKQVADAKKEEPAKPNEPKNCGGASVVLKENDYHRIKGLLSQWPNAASREVVKKEADNKPSGDFWVITTDDDITVLAKGKGQYKLIKDGGMNIIGKFNTRQAAEGFRMKTQIDGINTSIVERMGNKDESLSAVNYRVAFLKVEDQDAARLSEILKPYAKLQRNPCKK